MNWLEELCKAFLEYGKLTETGIIPSFLVEVDTTEKPLFNSQSSLDTKLFWVGIEVRDIGSASYVAIGTFGSVNSRLIANNSYIEFDAPKNKYLDGRTLMVVSDGNDAILEVTGVYAE